MNELKIDFNTLPISTDAKKASDEIRELAYEFVKSAAKKGLNTRQVDIALELIQAEIKECQLKY